MGKRNAVPQKTLFCGTAFLRKILSARPGRRHPWCGGSRRARAVKSSPLFEAEGKGESAGSAGACLHAIRGRGEETRSFWSSSRIAEKTTQMDIPVKNIQKIFWEMGSFLLLTEKKCGTSKRWIDICRLTPQGEGGLAKRSEKSQWGAPLSGSASQSRTKGAWLGRKRRTSRCKDDSWQHFWQLVFCCP